MNTNTTPDAPAIDGSPLIDKLAPALVAALPELGALARDREGKIQLQGGGGYSFKYADLKQLLDMAKPVLAEHGLVVLQPNTPTPGGARVQTVILHTSGQWISDAGVTIPAPKATDPKAFGSAISYARRYGLASMLSIAQADDDADAAGKAPRAQRKDDGEGTVRLAPKKKRDALQARIEALPAHYGSQIGQRVRAWGIAWSKITEDHAAELETWITDCEELAANEGK